MQGGLPRLGQRWSGVTEVEKLDPLPKTKKQKKPLETKKQNKPPAFSTGWLMPPDSQQPPPDSSASHNNPWGLSCMAGLSECGYSRNRSVNPNNLQSCCPITQKKSPSCGIQCATSGQIVDADALEKRLNAALKLLNNKKENIGSQDLQTIKDLESLLNKHFPSKRFKSCDQPTEQAGKAKRLTDLTLEFCRELDQLNRSRPAREFTF